MLPELVYLVLVKRVFYRRSRDFTQRERYCFALIFNFT